MNEYRQERKTKGITPNISIQQEISNYLQAADELCPGAAGVV